LRKILGWIPPQISFEELLCIGEHDTVAALRLNLKLQRCVTAFEKMTATSTVV
jgi:hypothetical protein